MSISNTSNNATTVAASDLEQIYLLSEECLGSFFSEPVSHVCLGGWSYLPVQLRPFILGWSTPSSNVNIFAIVVGEIFTTLTATEADASIVFFAVFISLPKPVFLNLFYIFHPFIKQDWQTYPQYTQWCSFIENTKLTNSYSWECFIKIYIGCNLFSKFNPLEDEIYPQGYIYPRLGITVLNPLARLYFAGDQRVLERARHCAAL